ncbi:KGG domain-containing protein [Deinococcus radiotolerans]|uniref:KGG domain-containing protein n=1 Tax=Deinococcus radiotolerans TaxID=1309407 RepID=UPI00227B2DA9|nr:KGG domain-containing protein [Deinococcus radiotolerans]
MTKEKDGNHQRSERGFAGMDPARRREIASQGGRAAHASGHAHQFTSEEAREAGRKGGRAPRKTGTAASRTTEAQQQGHRAGD